MSFVTQGFSDVIQKISATVAEIFNLDLQIAHDDGTNADLVLRREDVFTAGTGFAVIIGRAPDDDEGPTNMVTYGAIEILNRSKAAAGPDGQVNFICLIDGVVTDMIQFRGQTTNRGIEFQNVNIGFFGVAPVAQQSKITDPTDEASNVVAITAIIDVLEAYGLTASV